MPRMNSVGRSEYLGALAEPQPMVPSEGPADNSSRVDSGTAGLSKLSKAQGASPLAMKDSGESLENLGEPKSFSRLLQEWPAHVDPALALARSMTQLRSLTIARTARDRREFGDRGAAALAVHLSELTFLSHLAFSKCNMHERGLRSLAQALRALPQRAAPKYILPPPWSTTSTAPGSTTAKQTAAAESAAIAEKSLNPTEGTLPELRSLLLREDLPLDTTVCAESFQVLLESAPNIMRLSCGPFGSARIVSLAPIICSLRRLQTLDISSNMMSDPGAIALSHNLLRVASTLTSLDISGNAVTPAGMGALLPALAKLRELRTLVLDGNLIGNECANYLGTALRSMRHLRHLSMHSLGLGDAALDTVAPSLHCNANLTFLSLSNNFIGCKGMEVLGTQSLPKLPNLAEIRLSGNWMLDEGACMLASAAGTALTRIALDHAFVSDVGAQELTARAQNLKNLKFLSLTGNLIGQEGGTQLCALSGVRVDLQGNPWSVAEELGASETAAASSSRIGAGQKLGTSSGVSQSGSGRLMQSLLGGRAGGGGSTRGQSQPRVTSGSRGAINPGVHLKKQPVDPPVMINKSDSSRRGRSRERASSWWSFLLCRSKVGEERSSSSSLPPPASRTDAPPASSPRAATPEAAYTPRSPMLLKDTEPVPGIQYLKDATPRSPYTPRSQYTPSSQPTPTRAAAAAAFRPGPEMHTNASGRRSNDL